MKVELRGMKNTDEPYLRSAVITILVVTAIVAALLTPFPPSAHAPSVRLDPTRGEVAVTQVAHAAEPLLLNPVLAVPMRPVCGCESVGKPDAEPQHWDADGSVLRGRQNPDDIGMCQINEPTWGDKATELGWDIYTLEGNILMTNWIYSHEGFEPWRYSKGCHGKS